MKYLWVIFVLAVLGMGDAMHLIDIFYNDNAFVCNFSEKVNCTKVNHSQYAELAGVPVAFIGVFGYVLIALITGAIFSGFLPRIFNNLSLLIVAGLGFLFQLYLTAIEAFVLNTYCLFCLASQAIILAITVLAFLNLRQGSNPSRRRTARSESYT